MSTGRATRAKPFSLFPPDCPDAQWLAQSGESGWIAITHNARTEGVIGRAPAALHAEEKVVDGGEYVATPFG
jgi:hypothetical protein